VSSGADLRLAETIFFGLVEPDHTLSPNSAQWGQALQLSSLAGSFRISSWFFVAARALKNRNPGAAVWLISSPGGIRTCDQSINSRSLYR
jgi:hypothetical protein